MELSHRARLLAASSILALHVCMHMHAHSCLRMCVYAPPCTCMYATLLSSLIDLAQVGNGQTETRNTRAQGWSPEITGDPPRQPDAPRDVLYFEPPTSNLLIPTSYLLIPTLPESRLLGRPTLRLSDGIRLLVRKARLLQRGRRDS